MGTAPWYVSTMVPKVHHCMGGLYTDMEAHALDISTDKPIPGLFAAGEATGGEHGAARCASAPAPSPTASSTGASRGGTPRRTTRGAEVPRLRKAAVESNDGVHRA